MASAGIHFYGKDADQISAMVYSSSGIAPCIMVRCGSDDVSLYLPYGPSGISVARALAAALVKAADDAEALMAHAPKPVTA